MEKKRNKNPKMRIIQNDISGDNKTGQKGSQKMKVMISSQINRTLGKYTEDTNIKLVKLNKKCKHE